MKKLKSRIASLLVLVMVIGLVPSVAAAGIFENDCLEFADGETAISLEAEDDRIKYNKKSWYVTDFESASGGRVLTGQGGWSTGDQDPKAEGQLSFTFKVDTPGVYTVWVRAYNPSDTENSMWRRFDDKNYEQFWMRGTKDVWGWYSVHRSYLEAGEHTFEQRHRDPTVYWDRIIITSVVGFSPNGMTGMDEVEDIPAGKYYNVPPVTPPENQHPRLMFSEKDLPVIKNGIETIPENQKAYERLLELANKETDGFLDPTISQEYNGNSDLEGHIESCAFYYALDPENNYQYARTAYEHYINYTSTFICASSYSNAVRFYGMMVRIGAEVYDWCYHALTEEERSKVYQTIMSYAVQMEIGWPPTSQANFNSHAVESQLMMDLMSFATAVYDEHPSVWDVVAGRLYQEVIPAQQFEYGYGAQPEGSDYSTVRFQFNYYVIWMLKRMGYDEQYYNDSLEQAAYTSIMRYCANGQRLREGDCWNEGPGTATTDDMVWFLHYTLYKNPYTKYYFNMASGGNGYPLSNSGNTGMWPWIYLALNTEQIEEKAWDDLPLAYHFGDGNNSVEDGLNIRSDWKLTNEHGDYGYNMLITFSPYDMGGHQHCHSGTFQINYGSDLALDSGVYNTQTVTLDPRLQAIGASTGNWGSYTHLNYTAASIAHNVMLIRGDTTRRTVGMSHNAWLGGERGTAKFQDDGGQIGQSNSQLDLRTGVPEGTFHEEQPVIQATIDEKLALNTEMLGWDSYPDLKEPEYAYISGDLTFAYPAARVDSYVRSFVYLNLNEEGEERDEAALLVYDNMTAETTGLDKVWLLHTQEEPTIEGNRVTLQRSERGYTGKLTNDTLLPAEPEYELIGGKGREFELNGINMYRVSTKSLAESGKWRVEISNSKEQLQDDFMNVIQIGKADSPVYDTELVMNDDQFVGTKIKNKAVFMSKSKTKYKKPLTIGIDESNEGELSYIVTGVAKGRWYIKQDGKTIATYEVAEDHPTLTFKAPAGTYDLEWSYMKDDPDRDMTFMGNVVEKNSSTVKYKIATNYVAYTHPMIEKNGTQWLHVQETLDNIGFEPEEYEFSEDGRSLTFTETEVTLTASDNPDETNALMMIDGELYVPIINMDTEFSTRAYWFPISKCVRLDVMNRVTAEDKASIYDWEMPGFVKVKKGTQSYSDGTTNVYYSLDENNSSYVYVGELDEWLKYELKDPTSITRIEFLWHSGAQRSMHFEIQVSPDDVNYTTVYDGWSDTALGGTYEPVAIKSGSDTKYIKIIGHGNSSNDKFSLAGIRFFNN